jgi:hypothetical protein
VAPPVAAQATATIETAPIESRLTKVRTDMADPNSL